MWQEVDQFNRGRVLSQGTVNWPACIGYLSPKNRFILSIPAFLETSCCMSCFNERLIEAEKVYGGSGLMWWVSRHQGQLQRLLKDSLIQQQADDQSSCPNTFIFKAHLQRVNE
ncbi:hypothetical protein ILYODFUR_037774 [Ilyodon furcidens]|uniref:Uncharacterized protein n=1 Tax=Ilyodon furcidens TaxID=33524 RepID=A0ABV0TT45_9TELE